MFSFVYFPIFLRSMVDVQYRRRRRVLKCGRASRSVSDVTTPTSRASRHLFPLLRCVTLLSSSSFLPIPTANVSENNLIEVLLRRKTKILIFLFWSLELKFLEAKNKTSLYKHWVANYLRFIKNKLDNGHYIDLTRTYKAILNPRAR